MGFETALALSLGGIGAASSANAARQQNRAIERSFESQSRATETKQNQLAEAAALEKRKRINEAAQIEGRIRVAQGAGTAGNIRLLQQANDLNRSIDLSIIDRNFSNQIDLVQSGFEANIESLASRTQSPLLSGFSGGLSGVQTGLSIGQGVKNINKTKEP